MPLVVPGINNTSGGSTDEWLNKLMGKKLSDSASDATSFAKKDLPESHRIVKPGDMMTMDHRPERLNIHVDENDNVRDVRYG
ncbi:peptidase inhibitor I78 family-domain-containing protein [Aspergillus egyptiacus]|nr:peptidase inhibitor I78 family-domain-containing protein [Aspergillus egyptiacus]